MTHQFWSVDRPNRIAAIARLITDSGPTVVFCRTKRGADRVARQLADNGVAAAAIHGDRSQGQRDRALQQFRQGDVAALVATDVAARGIHVDDVACVVHYDLPADEKAYIHRSGRTARAGASGLVVTIVPPDTARESALAATRPRLPGRAHDTGSPHRSDPGPIGLGRQDHVAAVPTEGPAEWCGAAQGQARGGEVLGHRGVAHRRSPLEPLASASGAPQQQSPTRPLNTRPARLRA